MGYPLNFTIFRLLKTRKCDENHGLGHVVGQTILFAQNTPISVDFTLLVVMDRLMKILTLFQLLQAVKRWDKRCLFLIFALFCSKISKRDESSAAEALVAISSSDLFHGKTTEELEAAEALTSFRVDLDSVEIPTSESYTTTNLVENEQNITTDTSSQVTYRNIFLYIQVYLSHKNTSF